MSLSGRCATRQIITLLCFLSAIVVPPQHVTGLLFAHHQQASTGRMRNWIIHRNNNHRNNNDNDIVSVPPSLPPSRRHHAISSSMPSSDCRGSGRTVRYGTQQQQQAAEPTEDEGVPSASSSFNASPPSPSSPPPPSRRRHLARGLLLSSFSDGLVPNPRAVDFLMAGLVETMRERYVAELRANVESSAVASPCCGPTDVDSLNRLLDVDGTLADDGATGRRSSSSWKVALRALSDARRGRSSSAAAPAAPSRLELRFLYVPTAMYAPDPSSNSSPGKRRQRARADGKKRRAEIVRLIKDRFARAWRDTDDDGGAVAEEPPVDILAITLDFDDGSLKQPDGATEDPSKFPSTGMEALRDWNPHLIYVQGGNTFWLHHCMEKGNYRDALIDAISSERNDQAPAVYCGTSAGAILAGSLMETATWKGWDDPSVVPDRTNYDDWEGVAGLDLVGENVSIFPHMGDRWQGMVEGKVGRLATPHPPDGDAAASQDPPLSLPEVCCLRDDQVLCVNGSEHQPVRVLLEAPSATLEEQ